MDFYSQPQVSKNIYFDILQWMDNHHGRMKLDDLLLTIAVPCTRMDYASTHPKHQTRIMKAVHKFMSRRKLTFEKYTKESIRKILKKEWLKGLEDFYKHNLAEGQYSIVDTRCDLTGRIVLDKKIAQIYRRLMATGNNVLIEYGEQESEPRPKKKP